VDYFKAVQEGRARAAKALEILQDIAGPCYPLLFLKMGTKDWTPVGEENLFAVVQGKNDTSAVVLCDSEGNSKAMSAWVSRPQAESFVKLLESREIAQFEGEVRLPI
jgi:hypothetical protein